MCQDDYVYLEDDPNDYESEGHWEWECERCGAWNSTLDDECQFCDPPEQVREDWEADHRIDQRKHER